MVLSPEPAEVMVPPDKRWIADIRIANTAWGVGILYHNVHTYILYNIIMIMIIIMIVIITIVDH